MPKSLLIVMLFAMNGCVPAERRPGARDRDGAANQAATGQPTLARDARVELAATSADRNREAPPSGPTLQAPFKDDFERDSLGDDYLATGPQYRIERGRLCVKGAHNHPLWLRHRLPTNARIEVEALTPSNEGDIKLEAWGDGQAAASHASYTDATSYLVIFGGWKNRFHVLARLDEHAPDRPEVVIEPGSDDPRQRPVLADQRYRLKVERSDGRTVRFWVDDVEVLSFTDQLPLMGVGHDHFAFNNWETPVCFDHLVVEPLPS